MKIAGAWDIECGAWDRFLVGGMLGVDGEYYRSWHEGDFFDALCEKEGVWYAHAGGRYDALWFVGECVKRRLPWSARLRGSGVLECKVGKLCIRDSYALVPMSLAKAAEIGGTFKMDFPFACECGKDCGGYCVLSRPLAKAEKKKVEEYLRRDCDALLKTLQRVIDIAEQEDISLKLTVGSSAWATARAWLDLPPCGHDLGRYARLREGYYGGRTEVFRTRASDGHRYDIHSSYPAALTRVLLPLGEGKQYTGAEAARWFEDGKEGIYGADVWVPECDIPPLPEREKDRLLYPFGRFSGVWTGLELRHAVECGARIERMEWGYVWASAAPILRDYAQRIWDLRARAAENGEKSLANWYKWLANSLTGKLAQRPEQSSLRYIDADDPDEAPELEDGDEVIACAAGGVFIKSESRRVDDCAHVQWSAYLTAEARIELHRQLMSARRPLYCDTDSVYARDRLNRRLGENLGEWGYEGEIHGWKALAPKVYRYRDEKGADHVRGKGMSGLDSAGFDALETGGKWLNDRGVEGVRTQIRRMSEQLFQRRSLSRGLNPIPGWVGGRVLHADGSTSPTTVDGYRSRDKKGKRK